MHHRGPIGPVRVRTGELGPEPHNLLRPVRRAVAAESTASITRAESGDTHLARDVDRVPRGPERYLWAARNRMPARSRRHLSVAVGVFDRLEC